jgi:hypothetical protein
MKTQIVVPDVTPVSLDGKELFIIQFRLGYKAWKKHPASRLLPKGTGKKPGGSSDKKPGLQFLPSTEKMDISVLAHEVTGQYSLVDAFVEELDGEKFPTFMAQFTFADVSHAKKKDSWKYLFAFTELTDKSFWRTRGFVNSASEGGEMVVLNCHFPVHRLQDSGSSGVTPVVEWQKDEYERRIGDGPVPIRPSCSLGVINNEIFVF